jgi:protein SCO1/2
MLLITLGAPSCAHQHPDARAARSPRRFRIAGTVVGVDEPRGQLTIQHERIDGYMDAMTMAFDVRDAAALAAAQPGTQLLAILVVDERQSWIEAVSLTNHPSDAATLRRSFTLGAAIGQTVADFRLTNQDGRPISLGQFRGKAVALTFIYVRCPLPDFCPFVSRNFAAAERDIRGRPALMAGTQLLSITVDPEHDAPDVLRAYRARFLSDDSRSSNHWQLATGTPEQIRDICEFFGLQYWPESGQIVHSLRTVVIDPAGRITHVDPGNAWKPSGLIAELERAAVSVPP